MTWPGVICSTATPAQAVDGWDSKDTSGGEPTTCVEQSCLTLGTHEALLPLVLATSTCIRSFCHIAILPQRCLHSPTHLVTASFDEEAGVGGGPPIWYSLLLNERLQLSPHVAILPCCRSSAATFPTTVPAHSMKEKGDGELAICFRYVAGQEASTFATFCALAQVLPSMCPVASGGAPDLAAFTAGLYGESGDHASGNFSLSMMRCVGPTRFRFVGRLGSTVLTVVPVTWSSSIGRIHWRRPEQCWG